MGVAAYNRGSELLRRQLSSEQLPVEFEIMDRLNSLPKYPDAGKPFTDVCISESHGVHWIYCTKTGFGYWYKTLHEAVKRWDVIITGYNSYTREWTATPTP